MGYVKKVMAFLLLISIPLASLANANQSEAEQKLIKKVGSLESRLEQLEANTIATQKTNQHFSEILEKTNHQLSLWHNPYGVSIGILSVFFALLAVGVAIVLFKQSADHKKSIEKEIEQRTKFFNEFAKKHEENLEKNRKDALEQVEIGKKEAQEEFDKLIKEKSEKLKSADEKDRSEIRAQLEELKKEKAKLPLKGLKTVTAKPTFGTLSALAGLSHHNCKACGFGFKITGHNPGFASFQQHEVTCPNCGSVDLV